MANDAGNLPQNGSDADMNAAGGSDFDAVQLAQGDAPAQPTQKPAEGAQKTAAIPAVPNGTVHVEIPAGEKVVRVAVANGETVILPQPFDDQANLAAKEGNGNLAIKVGDITVILEGYQQTLADNAHPVVLKDEQGDTIDVAVVLASTDPNLDITTAAGPAVGAQGADNSGAIFAAFGNGAGLGGLNAVGVLDQTELNYKLIDNNIRLDRTDDLLPNNPITVTPPPPPGPNDNPINFVAKGTAVFESALAKGSDAPSPNEQTSGTIHIEAKDGVQTVTIGGVPVDLTNPGNTPTIPGTFGDVKITGWDPVTGDLTYTYTLNTNDPNHTKAGTDLVIGEDFPIVATDKDGDSDTGDLEIGIVDDVPTAKNDGISIGTATTHTSTVAENVEGNDIFGADGKDAGGGVVGVIKGSSGAASTTGAGTDIHGDHGTLHLNPDGSYTYTRDNGSPLTADDTFTYTIKDGDGDTSTALLTIHIEDNPVIVTPPPPPGPGDNPIDLNAAGTAVYESALATGSDPASTKEATSGKVTVEAKDGVDTVTIDGTTVNLANAANTPTITGTYGDLKVTGWDAATGTLTYTYTLTSADPNHSSASGNDVIPGEDFKIVATDKDGDKSSGDINISIVDDVPTAKNDTDLLGKGTNTATGNVITGADTTTGAAGADVKGADGGAVSKVVGFNGSTDSDASNGLSVDGQYGKLTMNADGTYTYTRDAGTPGGVTDTFTYTLKDGDGDTSTATLTINVDDDKPTVNVPTAAGQTTVDEKGLPAGSGELADGNAANDSDKSEKVSGNIAYTEGDAPAAITIQGKDGPVAVTVGATIVGADGTLTITSVGGGNIGYTYTLTTNTSGDATHDDFKVSVTDKDGDAANGTLVINIVDDVPTAHNDTDLVSNATNTATGNVITGADTTLGAAGADVKGADGATVSKLDGAAGSTDSDAGNGLTVNGQHGTLTMNADGTYTYTRSDGAPLQATDTFTYTLKDGDGDTSTATLTVTIDDSDIKITDLTPKANGGDVTVNEDDLLAARGAGESAGSDPTKESTTQGGDFKVSAPDGLNNLSIDGHAVVTNGVFTATSFTTALGNTLNVTGYDSTTGQVTYSYTLNDNENHPAGAGTNSLYEDFSVIVTDKDGDAASGTLTVNIVDDVPTAKNDTDTVDNATNLATGNVITGADTTSGAAGADVKGADGAAVSKLVGFGGSTDSDASNGLEVQGQYGKLSMNADGTYTYTRDPGTPGGASDTFTYTLTDGDGDTSTATLTVGIDDKNPTVHAPTADGQTQVFEKGLPAGSGELADGNAANDSDKSEKVSGNIAYTDGDAPAAITIQGKDGPVTVAVGVTITGADGTLTITSVGGGNIGYTYTLTTNTSGDATHDDFKISITDKDGDNATDTLAIKIVDDVPTAKADTDLVSNDTNTATGNVITGANTTSGAAGLDLKGADGASVSKLDGAGSTDSDASNGLTVTGQYGTLTMNADGTYTYTRFNGDPLQAVDTFNYTLKDGDGDTSTTTLKVTIDDSNCNITDLTPQANGGDVTVNENDLLASRGAGESAGTDTTPESTTQGGDFTINAPDGVKDLTVDGHAVITNGTFAATSFTTTLGNTLNVTGYDSTTGKVTYSYTLNDNESHAPGNGTNSLYENLGVKLTDKDGDVANGTLSVNIVDDVPQATSGNQVMGTDIQKNNVLLVLDTTGSMADPYPTSTSTTNKLQFEVQAAQNLLNTYLAAGGGDPNNVRVQIVTFAVQGTNQTTQWVTVADALAILSAIGNQSPDGNTNYDAGIAHALTVGWTGGGAIADASNTAYFFSDGLPNTANPGDGNPGLNGAQLTSWINYLDTNNINGYAVGLGAPNGSAMDAALDVVAYNGQGTGTDTQSINVTDPASLSAQIIATIGTNTSGNIVTDLGAKYGADGPGAVHSITLDGKTYTFNGTNAVAASDGSTTGFTFVAATHVLTVTTASGVFTIYLDTGAYTYHQNGGADSHVMVGYTLIDADGDISNGGSLYLLAPVPTVHLAADPVVPSAGDFDAAHTFIGNSNANTQTGTSVADWIDGKGSGDTMNGGLGNDVYVVDNSGDFAREKFDQGIDTVMTSINHTLQANVENLVMTGSDNLTGTGNELNNTMIGNSGNNVLNGGAGNDILDGGAGNDQLNGGVGNDQFLHVDSGDLANGKIDGGDGDDLVDLSHLATFKAADTSKIDNIEVLSFNGGTGTQVSLDYNSVLGMTDANHNLVIHGDQGSDSVALSGGFTKIGADITANDGQHYDIFQAGTGATQVTVFVDHNLNATAN